MRTYKQYTKQVHAGIKARQKFDGKMYRCVTSFSTKSDAVTLGKKMRKEGKLARVTKVKHLYVVWATG